MQYTYIRAIAYVRSFHQQRIFGILIRKPNSGHVMFRDFIRPPAFECQSTRIKFNCRDSHDFPAPEI